MTTLRDYQRAAIEATYAYWETEGGSPLIELATGTGKSVVIATMVRELMTQFPGIRILQLVHVKELVGQNAAAIIKTWPGAPVGINCAGLNRRDTKHPIICASVQSVAKQAKALGRRDLILVDEAHLIPHRGEGQYHDLIKELRSTSSPDLRLWGCTATPYRLDSGRLDQGENRLFDRIVYTYGIGEGVSDGHLVPLVARAPGTEIDVSSVARRGGEFLASALAAVADQDAITQAAVDEIVRHGANRRSWLVFASSVEHAHHVAEAISLRGVSCAVVYAGTPTRERAQVLAAFKAGHLRCIVNMGVLTTGFDAPATDLVALLRPTLSTGLYVQMLGRGTRCVGQGIAESVANGKTDCLILDFAGNVRRHGPVDDITAPSGPLGKGVKIDDVRTKTCRYCEALNRLPARECIDCGEPFGGDAAPKHDTTADTAPVLSGRKDPLDWREVDGVSFSVHRKFGAGLDVPPTMRVTYHCGRKTFSEWICVQHPTGSFPRKKAERWWTDRGGLLPFPATVPEAVERAENGDISRIDAIRVAKEDGHDRVIAHRLARTAASIEQPMRAAQ